VTAIDRRKGGQLDAATGAAQLRHRPIIGGVFGPGRYALASMPCVVKGLHAVRFMVIEPSSGIVLSIAEQKVDALDSARAVLRAAEQLAQASGDRDAAESRQGELWPRGMAPPAPNGKRRVVSKRRREIFAKSEGQCHYCAEVLTLDGAWHVEHMFPRALGGLDELGNLVASCVSCNLAKGDRTAMEFVLFRSSNGGL
jgi:hypothetical protein